MITKAIYFRNQSLMRCKSQIIYLKHLERDLFEVGFKETPCYPKGGGQPGDAGKIYGKDV